MGSVSRTTGTHMVCERGKVNTVTVAIELRPRRKAALEGCLSTKKQGA